MATPLKHRLVGTIILVALCVILLPDLLDGKKQRLPVEGDAIPLAPPFSEITLPEVTVDTVGSLPSGSEHSRQSVAPVDDGLPQLLPEQPVTVSAKPPASKPMKPVAQPEVDMPQLTETAWVVRLGAFRQKANVEKLLAKLRDAGFKAYTVPAENRIVDGELTRVFVGPDLSKASLESQQPELAKLTGLSAIAHYNPVKG